jgi:hypothetical protein
MSSGSSMSSGAVRPRTCKAFESVGSGRACLRGLSLRLREASDRRRHELSCGACFTSPLEAEARRSCLRLESRASMFERAMGRVVPGREFGEMRQMSELEKTRAFIGVSSPARLDTTTRTSSRELFRVYHTENRVGGVTSAIDSPAELGRLSVNVAPHLPGRSGVPWDGRWAPSSAIHQEKPPPFRVD